MDPFLLSSVATFVNNLVIIFCQIDMNFIKNLLLLLIVFIECFSMIIFLVLIHRIFRSKIMLCHRNVLKTNWLVLQWSSCLSFQQVLLFLRGNLKVLNKQLRVSMKSLLNLLPNTFLISINTAKVIDLFQLLKPFNTILSTKTFIFVKRRSS